MTSSLGFPSNPTINDQFVIGTKTFVWDGTVWNAVIPAGATLTQEEVQDYIAPLFNHSSHSNLTAIYDDNNNKILLNASGGGGGGETDIGLIVALS